MFYLGERIVVSSGNRVNTFVGMPVMVESPTAIPSLSTNRLEETSICHTTKQIAVRFRPKSTLTENDEITRSDVKIILLWQDVTNITSESNGEYSITKVKFYRIEYIVSQ